MRMAAGWEQAAVLDEYKKYAEPKSRECDVEYITRFDVTQLSAVMVGESRFHKMRGFAHAVIFSFLALVVWLFTGAAWFLRRRAATKNES